MMLKDKAHGGNVHKASDIYSLNIDEILDYSANINPLGVPKGLAKAIVERMDLLTYYPDPDYMDARKSLANWHGIEADNIIMGNGATEIIFLLIEQMKPRKILIPCPSFSEYEQAAIRFGSRVEYYRIKEETGYRIDSEDLIQSIDDQVEMLFLCNPNNPTGQIIERESMMDILSACRDKGVVPVIDEAFIDFVDEQLNLSVVDQIEIYSNLFIIKALTKFFAIPGLRLGYGIANKKAIKSLEGIKQPWSLNAFASLAAEILPKEYLYIKDSKRWIRLEGERFFKKLSALDNIKVFMPFGNFILIKLLDHKHTSNIICECMAKKGILIRNAENFNFLDKQYIRIAIKDEKDNNRFLERFAETLKEV